MNLDNQRQEISDLSRILRLQGYSAKLGEGEAGLSRHSWCAKVYEEVEDS